MGGRPKSVGCGGNIRYSVITDRRGKELYLSNGDSKKTLGIRPAGKEREVLAVTTAMKKNTQKQMSGHRPKFSIPDEGYRIIYSKGGGEKQWGKCTDSVLTDQGFGGGRVV